MVNNKFKKVIIIFSSSLFFLLILGGAFWWYWQGFILPNQIIKSMQNKMDNVFSFNAYGSIDISGELDNSGINIKINYDSFFNKKEKKMMANIGVSGFYEVLPVKADFDLIMLENESYFKINSLPEVIKFYEDMSHAENRWAIIESSHNETEIIDSFFDEDFFSGVKIVGLEEIEGNKIHKLEAKVDSSKVSDLFDYEEMLSIFTESEILDIKNSLEGEDELALILWIGKNDSYLYKVQGSLSFMLKKTNLDIDIILTMDDFNQNDNIKAPDVYEKVDELFSQFVN